MITSISATCDSSDDYTAVLDCVRLVVIYNRLLVLFV